MIRQRNMMPESAHAQIGRELKCWYVNSNAAIFLAATVPGTLTVGTPVTLLETLVRAPVSIAFVPTVGLTGTWVFDVVGENQFGEVKNERVSVTVAATVVHTLHCYRRLISVTPVTLASGGTDAVSIGTVLTVSGGGTPKVALPCKLASTRSAKYVVMSNAGTQPVFTVNGDPYHNISIATNPLVAAPMGYVTVWTDENEPNL